MQDECLHILIVDDNAQGRQATRRALQSSDLRAEADEVTTCAAALEALAGRAFDAVLLDFQLPDGTGLDVLRQAQAEGVDVPMVVLTGHGDEMVAVELMKAGAVDYLSRSKLTPEALARILRTAVRLSRADQRTRRAEAARRESAAQFQRVAESNLIGIMFWEPSGAVTGGNDAFLEMTGYTRADLESGALDWKALTPPEWAEQDARKLAELDAVGSCASFEKEYRRKDGSRVVVLISASMLDESHHKGLAFVVDITERRRAEEAQRFLAEASAVLVSSLHYQETLANVAHLAVPHIADWCAIDLQDEDGVIRRVVISHVDPTKEAMAREMGHRYPSRPDAPNGPPEVIRTGRSEMASEISDALLAANARDEEHLQFLRGVGLRSYMCVPLMARGRALGAITFIMAESGRHYTPDDLTLAEGLAHRAGLAVDNARLFFETRARAEREVVVNAIGAALRGSLDADEILRVATDEVGRLLGVSRCGWYWRTADGDELEVASQQYVAAGAAAFTGVYPLSIWPPELLTRWTASLPVVVRDSKPHSGAYRDVFLRPNSIHAYIACPVFLRGEWAGLFAVHQTDGPRDWTTDEVTLLRQISDMLAPTLENARLYAREHRVADMLQAAFLSNIPDQISDLALATVYRAGLDESRVGGDFYDAFALSDGRVGLVLGDVSGKGLSAAVLTATVKFSLRAFAVEVAAPGLVLTRLNRILRDESAGLGEHFVTLFYAVYDPCSGRLTYASAGHESQIVKRASGDVCLLPSTGPILGIAEHRFEQRQDRLGRGDTLILYTDGLTEARSAQARALFELERVVDLVGGLPREIGAGAIAAQLEQSALDWTAGRPQDDLALLVARRSVTDGQDRSGDSRPAILPDVLTEGRGGDGAAEDLLFEFSFPSRPDYAAEVRQAVGHWMGTLGFGREEVEDFQTAITEAVTNAVRHGSPAGQADQFRVSGYRVRDVSLVVEVSDRGPGLPPDRAEAVMPGPEAIGGRGLPLMQTLSDAVQYVPTGGGLRVRLTKRRTQDR